MSAFEGLDQPCPYGCDKTIGAHTLVEWGAHVDNGDGEHDLPWQPVGGDTPIKAILAGEELVMADTLSCRSMLAQAPPGHPFGVNLPCLVLEFQRGNPTGVPATVAEVAYLGSPSSMRRAGVLVRDAANGAANAAEKAGG